MHHQAEKCSINYEIVVYDDASPLPIESNEAINAIPHCSYKMLKKNIGRSSIRNLLAKDASYEYLLFLDADTYPMNNNFIASYIPYIKTQASVVYGGIAYQLEAPEKNKILRWKYGKSREALSVTERKRMPYLRFLTLNFLIKKAVFEKVRFNESIPNSRHEDTLFGQDLKKKKIDVTHINNPVLHHGLENNEEFLEKSIASVAVLIDFLREKLIQAEDVKLTKYACQLEKSGLKRVFLTFYFITKSGIRRNLLSENPSLLLFDLYRLGHFVQLKNEEHV